MTFLLLFNNMVPISLYVTVEMVNYVQAFFIDQDLEVRCVPNNNQTIHPPMPHPPMPHIHTRAQMYDPASETPAMARTSNMVRPRLLLLSLLTGMPNTILQLNRPTLVNPSSSPHTHNC